MGPCHRKAEDAWFSILCGGAIPGLQLEAIEPHIRDSFMICTSRKRLQVINNRNINLKDTLCRPQSHHQSH